MRAFRIFLFGLLSLLLVAATDVDYLRAGKFAEAKRVLEEALQHNPGSAPLQCNLGIALLRLHDYRPAYEHLSRATKLDPELLPGWLNLAACCICIGELDEAIEAYQHSESLAPSSVAALDKLIEFLRSAKSADETVRDYYVPGWRRWATGSNIKLFIAKASNPHAAEIAEQAMRDVVGACGSGLQLQIVSSKQDANLTCEWSMAPAKTMMLERGVAGGIAKNGKIAGATVHIFLNNESGLNFVSDDTLRKSCLHEFMHALGVAGHSTNVEDIMFPMIELPTVEARLTPRDRATLQRLYSE